MFEIEARMSEDNKKPWMDTLHFNVESDIHEETKLSLKPIENRGE